MAHAGCLSELFCLTWRSFLFGRFRPREAVLCSAARLTDNHPIAVMSLLASRFNDKLRRLFKRANTCVRVLVCLGNLAALIKCFRALAAVRTQSSLRRPWATFEGKNANLDSIGCDALQTTRTESSKEDSHYFSDRSRIWRLSGCSVPTGEQTKKPRANVRVQVSGLIPNALPEKCHRNDTASWEHGVEAESTRSSVSRLSGALNGQTGSKHNIQL